eukprot:TRINITY_DN7108_c0_g1_i1.p1 TRINITY_DN7108_c0_g1~~TRINITY_DN7108_c0_g1_i1.p1  ORF type:complete len:399 (+),score=90.32 TRINITY_DN7108_c0_g1_i1:76-1197(+)
MRDSVNQLNLWIHQAPEQAQGPMREHTQLIKEFMDAVSLCSSHQMVIVSDVLNLSRLEANKLPLQMIDFSPTQVLDTVAKMFDAEVSKKGIELVVVPPKDQTRLIGDPHCISQVLLNLISNAIKFTNESNQEKRVSVSFEMEPSDDDRRRVCLKVSDNGIGMTEEESSHLFHRFSQANTKTLGEYGGSGLGLVITKAMIYRMGGEIKVESKIGQGTVFIVMLSFKVATEITKDQPTEMIVEQVPIDQLNKRVLIVEDNEVNQRVLQRHLKGFGCECRVARNGEEGFNMCLQYWDQIDVVLMDIEMPIMNGLQSTAAIRNAEIKEGKKRIPIIGLSGNARPEQVEMGLKSGMDAYLVKPYTKEGLARTIHQWSK